MKRITIEVAENGYIARASFDTYNVAGQFVPPYVFESFDKLTGWLSGNLEKPTSMKDMARNA